MFDAIRQNAIDVNELESMCFVKPAKNTREAFIKLLSKQCYFCFFFLLSPPSSLAVFPHILFQQIDDARYKNQTQG
jgi:hypothetical protein